MKRFALAALGIVVAAGCAPKPEPGLSLPQPAVAPATRPSESSERPEAFKPTPPASSPAIPNTSVSLTPAPPAPVTAPTPPPLRADAGAKNGVHLTRDLPFPFTATGSFSAAEGGLKLANNAVITTEGADYLSKDFVFDVWVNIPKQGEQLRHAFFGIGDGKWDHSLGIVIYSLADANHGLRLTHGDQWGQIIGEVREPGVYIFRVERHLGAVTLSLGSEQNGAFSADLSQTVQDPKSFMPALSERSAHLFFSGDFEFSRVRLFTGDAVASGAAARAPANPADEDGAPLTRDLPSSFIATGPFSAAKGGLQLANHAIIETEGADYLSKDFIFDVWVYIPKQGEQLRHAFVGIGDGKWDHSLGLVMYTLADANHGLRLTHGDQWGQIIGEVREPGIYIFRVQRHLGAVTLSLGSEQNGKFSADLSQTVQDPKSFMPALSERSAHLFFSGDFEFSRVRLLIDGAGRKR